MKLLTCDQMRAVEAQAKQCGATETLLIHRAGEAIADELAELLQGTAGQFCVLLGPGYNGDDALQAALRLRAEGFQVVCWDIFGSRKDKWPDQQYFQNVWQHCTAFLASLNHADCIVDGIFGIGARKLDEQLAELVGQINAAEKKVVAIDIPTGLDADSGEIPAGIAVSAETTICLGYAKQGLLSYPARDFTGQIVVCPIGLDNPAWLPADELVSECIDTSQMKTLLPAVTPKGHKGIHGKVCVLAGSPRYPGAALLATSAAYRAGAGWVGWVSFADAKVPFAVVHLSPDRFMAGEGIEEGFDAYVIGPGLGQSQKTRLLFDRVLSQAELKHIPVVIDADALAWLSHDAADRLADQKIPLILTPHPGEMARMLRTDAEDINKHRIDRALALSRDLRAWVVLKGANTIVARPDGAVAILDAQVASLAVAGTGDILSGMIGGLLAQGLKPWDALRLAVWAHAQAGELWQSGHGQRGMIADDLLTTIPRILFP